MQGLHLWRARPQRRAAAAAAAAAAKTETKVRPRDDDRGAPENNSLSSRDAPRATASAKPLARAV